MLNNLNIPIKFPLWKLRLLQGIVILLVCSTLYLMIGSRSTEKLEGQKIEINKRIQEREVERTTMQKIANEAFKNGLSSTAKTQEKHLQDEKDIKFIIVSMPDSTVEKLFEKHYGQLQPINR
ncbi:hypothetical protein QM480_04135 [Flectobacillus sp. DC10W]|uniref:Uncharacterized protein n=1 Tax=Flectobacillus longus TaxID=2984207 RepID=A0ABT6YIT7_9BACT|nr:hypothetical protein [Flectobacillus longus]MDI9863498.1 hypothetical protein [Flectobacillus longus]